MLLRQAVRELRRRPFASALAVATLAVGVGAVTVVYSVVDAVLLRPLPFREPDRLVSIWSTSSRAGETQRGRVTGAMFADWTDPRHGLAATIASQALFGNWSGTLLGRGEPRALRGAAVSEGYFETLGVEPEAGRLFSQADPVSERLAVASHHLAVERLGGVESAVGSRLDLDGQVYEVIGVAPPGVYPTSPTNGPRMQFRPDHHDLFLPLPPERLLNRISHVFGVVARLADGVELPAAAHAIDLVSKRIAAAHPETADDGAAVRPLVDEAVGDVRAPLRLLLAAATLVLAAACASVGGLVVARAAERRHELALRRALGAGDGALAGRFLAEALLVAAAGAAFGAALAAIALRPLLSRVPQEIPRLADAAVDTRALGVAVLAALVASAAFALLPLALSRRLEVAEALRDGVRGGGSGLARQRLRSGLVTAQVALAALLAIGAALLGESYRRLTEAAIAVATEDVVALSFQLDSRRYAERAAVTAFHDALLDGVRALPGVRSAQLAYDGPLESNWTNGFDLEGLQEDAARPWSSDLRFVSPGYFAGLDIALTAGRDFQVVPPGAFGHAVVDELFARRFLGGRDPLGAILVTSVGVWAWGEEAPRRFEIVGVVETVRPPEPGAEPQPTLYLDLREVPQHASTLLVRASAEPAALVAGVKARLAELDPSLAVAAVSTLEAERRLAVAQPRFNLELITLFGALALLFSALGVYGLLASWVAARRQEIGVRLALGARRAEVAWLVAFHGVRLVGAGVALGALGALVAARFAASELHGVSAADPRAYLTAPLAVLAGAALAALAPAVAAARTDPAIALRDD